MSQTLTRRAALKAILTATVAAPTLALLPDTARASSAEVYTGFLSDLAVGGYDPVAYFSEGRPVEGSEAFELEHRGATWRFASATNRDAFRADPDRYAPQYGGYCAWAVSQGYRAKGDPAHWKVVDGRLYLNYNGDVQRRWEQDIPGNIRAADINWPGVLD